MRHPYLYLIAMPLLAAACSHFPAGHAAGIARLTVRPADTTVHIGATVTLALAAAQANGDSVPCSSFGWTLAHSDTAALAEQPAFGRACGPTLRASAPGVDTVRITVAQGVAERAVVRVVP